MCGGIPVHIVSFTVGGGPSVEIRAVPGSKHGGSAFTSDGKAEKSSKTAENNFTHEYLYITVT